MLTQFYQSHILTHNNDIIYTNVKFFTHKKIVMKLNVMIFARHDCILYTFIR